MALAVHPNQPKNYLDFSAKFRSNVDAFERVCNIIQLAIKTFAQLSVIAPLAKVAKAAGFAKDTINAIQVVNPIAYFYKKDFAKSTSDTADKIINISSLYLSICAVIDWVQEHAKDLAVYAANVGKSSPIFGSAACVNFAAYALPAVAVLNVADLYTAANKLNNATNVVEKNKAMLTIAKDVSLIAFATLSMAAFTAPAAATAVVALEFSSLFLGLAGDIYQIQNPS
jgi:hypothetical protein